MGSSGARRLPTVAPLAEAGYRGQPERVVRRSGRKSPGRDAWMLPYLPFCFQRGNVANLHSAHEVVPVDHALFAHGGEPRQGMVGRVRPHLVIGAADGVGLLVS